MRGPIEAKDISSGDQEIYFGGNEGQHASPLAEQISNMNLSELGPRFPQSISFLASFLSRFLHPHSLHCTSWPMSSKGTRDRGGNMFFCSCLLRAKLFSSHSSEGRRRGGTQGSLLPPSLVEVDSVAADWAMGRAQSQNAPIGAIHPSPFPRIPAPGTASGALLGATWSLHSLWGPLSKFMLLLARTLTSPQKSCQYLQWGNQWLSSIRSTPDWLDVPTQMCLRRENTHTKKPCTSPRIWTYTVQCLIFQMQPRKLPDPEEFHYLIT